MWKGRWGCLALAAFLIGFPMQADAEGPRIAVVIDDLGYVERNDRAVLALDSRIAVAIIPDGPLAPVLSREAAVQQREVLIHLPLSGLRHDDCAFGATCPDPAWSPLQMTEHLLWATGRVENAIGINNHQGSRFTSDQQAVATLVRGIELLERLHRVPLFVLDSRTTPNSLLEAKASRAGLATTSRNVFLDNDRCPHAIEKAWGQLIELARREGTALAIGHPHRETIEFLTRAVPELDQAGVELVPVSRVLDSVASR